MPPSWTFGKRELTVRKKNGQEPMTLLVLLVMILTQGYRKPQ